MGKCKKYLSSGIEEIQSNPIIPNFYPPNHSGAGHFGGGLVSGKPGGLAWPTFPGERWRVSRGQEQVKPKLDGLDLPAVSSYSGGRQGRLN